MSLEINKHTNKSILVKGDKEKYSSDMKKLGGKWFSKLQGWLVPVVNEDKVKEMIKNRSKSKSHSKDRRSRSRDRKSRSKHRSKSESSSSESESDKEEVFKSSESNRHRSSHPVDNDDFDSDAEDVVSLARKFRALKLEVKELKNKLKS